MRNIILHIPNMLTLSNAFFGCLALAALYQGAPYESAAWWIALGALCDFLDGAVARALKVSSPLGKELDSLADMVTFGVVPASVAFRMLQNAGFAWASLAFLIAAASALRLARFNLDERQTNHFIGVPTPANTLFWIGLPFLLRQFTPSHHATVAVLLLLVVLSSYWLLAPWALLSLKFKNLSWHDNRIRYIFVVLSILCLLLLQWSGLSLLIVLYVLLSWLFFSPKQ
ncbi:MAG: CDP-diacylglycerol--serine O-phosphatidyltransferase [Thermonema sp.]|uniref:CDP-diacylglycerol--serine O-phosphatidyltransferase n=1 Tax=Thermonema sp. TaxID=2231181 RepID=UPI0021DDFB8C|nr:CDP-diacylglycerol--serine O-phosphatidyltransferase [Thermonema sp.]GIV39579.1 MAG: CDP-diacylglycerol--serine O-phosphatidyltransferase [Thermonema sp.]